MSGESVTVPVFDVKKHSHDLNDPDRKDYISYWRKKAKAGGVKFLEDKWYGNAVTIAYITHTYKNTTSGELSITICSQKETFHKGLGRAIAAERLLDFTNMDLNLKFKVSTSKFLTHEKDFIYALSDNHIERLILMSNEVIPQEIRSIYYENWL